MTIQQLLENRFSALSRGDYGMVYDSYHTDAPFLQQFDDRNNYIDFAREQLGFVVMIDWLCPRQRTVTDDQVEVVLVMEIAVENSTQFFYELALLIETQAGWRYHSAQKLGADDYSDSPQQIDFHHFDNATEKIRF
ncbi:MAG: hypothetical protein U9R69_07350 [Thermodesulfobacteriota bacterium]|nr:hypothetical protein [Thermodesulfobacteriota bacterium]